ncbi:metallophosphoesterase family protein [Ligilactobacillus agilis]|uniref:metallophosphoesterase family protein n=1 Tax=Ligilactobacillus agilis TaxID=1601 RepID=UPI001F56DAC0|nr:metallophosphoesterase family protein [Ligilactobacillus agilis]UNL43219.1 metallophosphoesterase family protein [Ligilactobacillus agilis]UNL57781.1 metallophosphoesterase family protein [Ligilactobacillus agilis]
MTRKIGIFSDVHGNYTALKAVYEDALALGVDDFWFLGDLFSPGPGAQDLWELFTQMNPSYCLRGNWDDLLVNSIAGRLPTDKESKIYFAKLAQTLAKRLAPEVVMEIERWPLAKQVELAGLKVGLSHNLPTFNHGQTLYPLADQANFDQLFELKPDLDLAVYAHVHHPLMRYSSQEQLIFNPGSVGQPFSQHPIFQADLRANYLVLTLAEKKLTEVDFRKVDYDHQAELKRAQAVELPYLDLYEEQLVSGRIHSHDYQLLAKINTERGYRQDVLAYNQAKKRFKN